MRLFRSHADNILDMQFLWHVGENSMWATVENILRKKVKGKKKKSAFVKAVLFLIEVLFFFLPPKK